jgi:site-specific DNA recombinase
MTDPTRCAVYSRYSSDRQSPSSIEDQSRKCTEFAARQGWQILPEYIYSDAAISGATDRRTGLQALLAAAESKPRPFDVVLADDSSRLSRNLADSLNFFDRLEFAGVRLIFISQGIDSDNAQASVLVAVHGMVDGLYISELSGKVWRGIEGQIQRGFHSGGRCFGYRSEPIEHVTKTDNYGRPIIQGVRLVIDEAQATTVRRIFTLCANGKSFKGIAKQLNAEHVTSPQPQKGRLSQSWCPSSIRKILHNDRYRGLAIWGKTRKVRSPKTGKRIYRSRSQNEWVMREAPEQRIVSDELWAQVQQRIEQVKVLYAEPGRRAGLLRSRAVGSQYLFSGLVKCGSCGANMTIVSGRGRNRPHSVYGCPQNAFRGETVCSNNLRIRREALETQLLSKLQSEVLRDEVVKYTLERFEQELLKALDAMGGELETMRQRKHKLEEELQNLTRSIADGQCFPSVISAIGVRENELREITDRLLESRPDSVRSRLKNIRTFVISRLKDLRGLLDAPVLAARAEIVKHIQSITLYPDGRTYVASGTWDLVGEGAMGVCRGAESNCLRRPFQGRALPVSYLGTGTIKDSTE